MRKICFAAIGVLAAVQACIDAGPAFSQAKKGAASAPKPKTFTIDFSEGTSGGLPVNLNATLRETRQGAFIEEGGDSAIVGWACHSVNFDGQGVGQSVRFDVGGRNEQFANERTRVVLFLQVAAQ